MEIVHIVRPGQLSALNFAVAPTPAAVDGLPSPKLATQEFYGAPDGTVHTGVWEASPGTFRRAIVDAEFSHFISGHATFVAEDGTSYEFRGGNAAYFPPNTKGVWTVHETLRKTYCVWR